MLPQGSAFHLLFTTTTSVTISCQPPSFLPTSAATSLTSTSALSKRKGQLRPTPVISGPDLVSAMVVSRVSMPPTLTASYPTLVPVSFSYSGASVFTKKSSNALMNELSRTVPRAFGALPPASARRGASAVPVATRLTVRKSRRVVMNASVCADGLARWVAAMVGSGCRGCQVMDRAGTYLTERWFQQMLARIQQESHHTYHFNERDIWLATTALMGPDPVAIS